MILLFKNLQVQSINFYRLEPLLLLYGYKKSKF